MDGSSFCGQDSPLWVAFCPQDFHRTGEALEWCVRAQGVDWLIHYIDDFLTAGNPSSTQCMQNLACIKAVCAELGFPLKVEKVVGPCTSLDFLCIVLDTVAMEL